MKRYLLHITCVLFLCQVGFAQSPVSRTGTISVLAPKHLQINIDEPNLQFTYNEFGGWPPTDSQDNSSVIIEANVNWKLEVSPLDGAIVLKNPNTTMTIPASQFEYRLTEIIGVVNSGTEIFHKFDPLSTTPITGSKNVNFKLYWRPNPDFSGNLFAGDYKIGISYRLIEL